MNSQYFSQQKAMEVMLTTDYRRPEKKLTSLHGRKFNPNPKYLGMAAAYFVCDARCHRACSGRFANDRGRVPLSLI